MTYVFLGTESDIGPIALRYFGQRVELPEERDANDKRATFAECLLGGCDLIPLADFEAFDFTDQELMRFRYPAAQSAQTEQAAAFRRKRDAALERAQALRVELEGK